MTVPEETRTDAEIVRELILRAHPTDSTESEFVDDALFCLARLVEAAEQAQRDGPIQSDRDAARMQRENEILKALIDAYEAHGISEVFALAAGGCEAAERMRDEAEAAREEAESRLRTAETALRLCASSAGMPDAGDGCRAVIKIVKETLEQVTA